MHRVRFCCHSAHRCARILMMSCVPLTPPVSTTVSDMHDTSRERIWEGKQALKKMGIYNHRRPPSRRIPQIRFSCTGTCTPCNHSFPRSRSRIYLPPRSSHAHTCIHPNPQCLAHLRPAANTRLYTKSPSHLIPHTSRRKPRLSRCSRGGGGSGSRVRLVS